MNQKLAPNWFRAKDTEYIYIYIYFMHIPAYPGGKHTVVEFRGDWLWHRDFLRLSANWQSTRVCHTCVASSRGPHAPLDCCIQLPICSNVGPNMIIYLEGLVCNVF